MSTKGTSTTKTGGKGRQRQRRVFTAAEKCEAVLSIWTERQSMAEVGRKLNVCWTTLSSWQEQALDGMLEALRPKERKTAPQSPALSTKLQKLLEKKGLTEDASSLVTPALQKRLAGVQKTGEATA